MHKPKVAILFWGITRSLKFTIKNIEKNLFNVLYKNDFEIHKFIHTFIMDNPTYSNMRAKEYGIKLDFEEYKLLNTEHVEIENQDKIAKKIGLEKYRTMGNPWKRKDFQTLDNFILASYSKYRVSKMMEKSKINFDYVIYMRPDVLCLNKFPIKSLKLLDKHTNSCLIPNFELYGKWNINDRMYISKMNNYQYFGKYFKYMLNDSANMQLHSETYIGYNLNKNGITVHYIDFYFNRVRANGYMVNDYFLKG